MILGLHIGIALLSMVWAGYAFFSPGRAKIIASCVLIVATLGTGMYLVVMAPSHMLEVCTVGVTYLAITTCATVLASHKLKSITE